LEKEQKTFLQIIKNSNQAKVEIEIDEMTEVSRLRTGDSFGEMALISDRLRAATIQTLEKSSFLVLSKSDFTQILGDLGEKRLNLITKFMLELAYFHDLSKISLIRLAYHLEFKMYTRTQYLFQEGDKTDGIYFIKNGEVTISKKIILKNYEVPQGFAQNSCVVPTDFIRKSQKNVQQKIVIKGKNESVGSLEVIDGIETRRFTCYCSSSHLEVYFMPKDIFNTRIPNLEFIKPILCSENGRLTDRYNKFNEDSLNATISTSQEIKFATPIKPLYSLPLILQKSVSKKLIICKNYSQKKSLTPLRYTRKFTQKEIYNAVNGRAPEKRISPPRFSQSPFRNGGAVKFIRK
jgi:CRP-like cAMP-binding protein